MYIKSHAELALHIQGFHMLRLQQLWIGNTQKKKKKYRKFQKAEPEFAVHGKCYLHNIYIVLDIISNLRMI